MAVYMKASRLLLQIKLIRTHFFLKVTINATSKNTQYRRPLFIGYYKPKEYYFSSVSDKFKAVNQGKEELNHLRIMASKYHYIDKERILEILEHVKHEGILTELDGYYLLKCSGSMLVKETEDNRMKVLNKVWDNILNYCETMTVQHYNLKSRMMIENGLEPSPIEFITELNLKKLVPNQESYQILHDLYCERGDIEGAKAVLTDMKKQQIKMTEDVFNSKIKCYLKRNAKNEARKILTSMWKLKIEPSCHTYMTFAKEFAKQGATQAMDEIMQEASDNDEHFQFEQLLDLYFLLHIEGHTSGIYKILEYIEEKTGSFLEILTCLFKLVVHGKEEAVYSLLPIIVNNTYDGVSKQFIKNIVKLMFSYNWCIESILKFNEESERLQLPSLEKVFLAYLAVLAKRPECSRTCLELAWKQGESVEAHHFIGIFEEYAKKKNIKEMNKTAEILMSTCENRIRVLEILATNFAELLCQMGVCIDTICTNLQTLGLTDQREINSLKFLIHVVEGNHEEVRKLVNNQNMHIDFKQLLRCVNQTWKRCDNMDSVIETFVTAGFALRKRYVMANFYSEVICRRLKNCSDVESNRNLLLKITEKDIPIRRRNNYSNYRLQNLGLEEDEIIKIEYMIKKNIIDYKEMSSEEYKRELRKGPPYDPLLLGCMLHFYCDSKNMEKIDETLALMDSSNCKPSSTCSMKIIQLQINHGNVEKVLEFKNDLFFRYGLGLSKYMCIQIAKLQLERGHFAEALSSLKQEGNIKSGDFVQPSRIHELLSFCRKNFSRDESVHLFEELFHLQYIHSYSDDTCHIDSCSSDNFKYTNDSRIMI